MNYGELNEKALAELKEIGCNAATMEQALDYIEGAFDEWANPIAMDDEENPTELTLDYVTDYYDCFLKDYASVEEMFNDFVVKACGVVSMLASKRWDDEHSVYVRDPYCGNYTETYEADSVAECVEKYYGRI